MTAPESILEKVRKLLALSRGTPNPGEAETAMAIAQRLMLEHGLEMAAASRDDGFQLDTAWEGQRLPPESHFVWAIVDEFFFCFPIWSGKELLLLGRPEHVAIGRYVGVFLSRTFRALWSVYRTERRALGRARRPYYLGLQAGICERLARDRLALRTSRPDIGAMIRSHGADLLAEVRRRFAGQLAPRSEMRIARDGTAFEDGLQRGRKIDIRTPLPAGGANRRIAAE